MHALDPFQVTSVAADHPGLSGRVRPRYLSAHLPAPRAPALAPAPVPLVVALHLRGLADKAPALRKAGFLTFRSLLEADPARLASVGISFAELGVHEPSASLALVPARSTSRSPRRSDLPAVSHTTRGSRAAVAAALATEHGRQAALRRLDADVYANSARAPRDSLWATWVFVANAWGIPPVPVTEDTVRRVAAGLKAGGYRVPEQYFSRARQEHLRQVGSPIDAAAEQAMADCSRSVTRGIGPSSLKHSFPFEDLAPLVVWPSAAQLAVAPPEGPLFPIALLVVGCWWLCRGIELAAATVGDVTLIPGRSEVSLALPVSKTDPKALGTSRTHGCLCCVEDAPLAPLCPFHFLTRYLALLNDYFSGQGQDQVHCLPLFPTASGEVLSKAQVVHALRVSIATTGTPLVAVDACGVHRQRFGEHVARVAGAQALARAGVDISLIELIGRWGSSAVRRYVQQAALAVQPLVAARLARGAAFSAELLATQAVLSQRLLALEDAAQVPPPLDDQPSDTRDLRRFVKNLASACVHVSLISSLELPREAWATRCDWRFGGRPREFCCAVPDEDDPAFRFLCEKCFPGARPRKGRRTGRKAESSSSSSSSSTESSDAGHSASIPEPGAAQHAAKEGGARSQGPITFQ